MTEFTATIDLTGFTGNVMNAYVAYDDPETGFGLDENLGLIVGQNNTVTVQQKSDSTTIPYIVLMVTPTDTVFELDGTTFTEDVQVPNKYSFTFIEDVYNDATIYLSGETVPVLKVIDQEVELDVSWYSADATSFELDTADEFIGFMSLLNGSNEAGLQDDFTGKTVTLTADIDLEGITLPGSVDSRYFGGTFDGNGKKLIDLVIDGGSEGYGGLFYQIKSTGTVKNLTIESGSISGRWMGSFAYRNDGIIANCVNKADLNGYSFVGGLVNSNYGSIVNCANYGAITNTVRQGWSATMAGIASYVGNGALLLNCYNLGSLDSLGSDGCEMGGIAYTNDGRIVNCYNGGALISGAAASGDYYSPRGIAKTEGEGIENSYFIQTGTINAGMVAYGEVTNGAVATLTAAQLGDAYVDAEGRLPMLTFEANGVYPEVESADSLKIVGAQVTNTSITLTLNQEFTYLPIDRYGFEFTLTVEGEDAFVNTKGMTQDGEDLKFSMYNLIGEISDQAQDAALTVTYAGETYEFDCTIPEQSGYFYDTFYTDETLVLEGDNGANDYYWYNGEDTVYILRRNQVMTDNQNLGDGTYVGQHFVYKYDESWILYTLDMTRGLVSEHTRWNTQYTRTNKYDEAVENTVDTYSDITGDGFFGVTSLSGASGDVLYLAAMQRQEDGSAERTVLCYDVEKSTITELDGGYVGALIASNGQTFAMTTSTVHKLVDGQWEKLDVPALPEEGEMDDRSGIQTVWGNGDEIAVVAAKKLDYEKYGFYVYTSDNNGKTWTAHTIHDKVAQQLKNGTVYYLWPTDIDLEGTSLENLHVAGFRVKHFESGWSSTGYGTASFDGESWDVNYVQFNSGHDIFGKDADHMIYGNKGFLEDGGYEILDYQPTAVLTTADGKIVILEMGYDKGLNVYTANVEIPEITEPAYTLTVKTEPEGAATVTARYLKTENGKDTWRLNITDVLQGYNFSKWSNGLSEPQIEVQVDSNNTGEVVFTAACVPVEIKLDETLELRPVIGAPSSSTATQLSNTMEPTNGQPLGIRVSYHVAANVGSANLTVTLKYKDGEEIASSTNTWVNQGTTQVVAGIDMDKLKAANGVIVATLSGSKTTELGAEINFNDTREYTVDLDGIDQAMSGEDLNIKRWEAAGGKPVTDGQNAAGALIMSVETITDEVTGITTIYTAGPGGITRKTTAENQFTAMSGDFNTGGEWGQFNNGIYAIGGTDEDNMLLFMEETVVGDANGRTGIHLYTLNEEDRWVAVEGGAMAERNMSTQQMEYNVEGLEASWLSLTDGVVLGDQVFILSNAGLILWNGEKWAVSQVAEGITLNSLEKIDDNTIIAGSNQGLWKYASGAWSQITWSTNEGINESLDPSSRLYVLSGAPNGNVYVAGDARQDYYSKSYLTNGDIYRVRTARTTDMYCVAKMPVDTDHTNGSYTMGEDFNGNIYAACAGISCQNGWNGSTGGFLYSVDTEKGEWKLINVGGDMYDYSAGGTALYGTAIKSFITPQDGLTLFTGYFATLYAIDELPEGSVDMDSVRANAKAELKEYYESFAEDNYTEEEYADLTDAYEDGVAAIEAAENLSGAAEALEAAKAALDAVKPSLLGSKTVRLSVSKDGTYFNGSGTVLASVPVTVEYFDLALYGLEEFYKYGADGEVLKQPTVLHLFIYATEVFYCDVDASDAGKGYLFNEGLLGTEALNITGSATSLYMTNFWGHSENLTYYHNHAYPLMSEGWGSTADWILLNNGDFVELAMYTDWSFWQNPNAGFKYVASADGSIVDEITQNSGTLSVRRATADGQGGRSDVTMPNVDVYWIAADDVKSNVTEWHYLTKSDADGKFTYDFSDMEAGDYYIGVAGDGVSSPGMIIVHKTDDSVEEDPDLLGDANSDGIVNNVDAMLILQYSSGVTTNVTPNLSVCDVNGDGTVNNVDAMLVLQYSSGVLEKFPVE